MSSKNDKSEPKPSEVVTILDVGIDTGDPKLEIEVTEYLEDCDATRQSSGAGWGVRDLQYRFDTDDISAVRQIARKVRGLLKPADDNESYVGVYHEERETGFQVAQDDVYPDQWVYCDIEWLIEEGYFDEH